MTACIVIGLIGGGLIALLLYLYEEYVDELKQEIRKLQIQVEELDKTAEAYGEIIDDQQHYYDKWREAAADLDEATERIWELEEEINRLTGDACE